MYLSLSAEVASFAVISFTSMGTELVARERHTMSRPAGVFQSSFTDLSQAAKYLSLRVRDDETIGQRLLRFAVERELFAQEIILRK